MLRLLVCLLLCAAFTSCSKSTDSKTASTGCKCEAGSGCGCSPEGMCKCGGGCKCSH